MAIPQETPQVEKIIKLVEVPTLSQNAYLPVSQGGVTYKVSVANFFLSSGILGVTRGGTGTSTQFTQNSVVFAGPNGVYAQDNANLYFNDTDNWLHANKLAINTTYSSLVPYSFEFKAVDSTYNFRLLDSSSNVLMASQTGNLFLSSTHVIRPTANSLSFIANSYNGTSFGFSSITSSSVFTGNSNFTLINPSIRTVSTDTQTGLFVKNEVEQSAAATGITRGVKVQMNQGVNLTRLYSCTSGQSYITITDARGTTGMSNGDTVTGSGIPAATTISSISGSQVNLSAPVTATVSGAFLTDTSVTYTASNIYDYRAFDAEVGASSTQKAFYATDGTNLLFAVGGNGAFAFKGGTYAVAETGWTDTSTNYVALRNLAFDLSTVTATDANFRLLARAFLTLEIALKNKGLIAA